MNLDLPDQEIAKIMESDIYTYIQIPHFKKKVSVHSLFACW